METPRRMPRTMSLWPEMDSVKAKQAVEAVCPAVVSCADRDVVLSGGPSFAVELGRFDGRISEASRVPASLPFPGLQAQPHRLELPEEQPLLYRHDRALWRPHCWLLSLQPFLQSPLLVVFLATSRTTLRAPADAGVPAERRPFGRDPTTPAAFDNAYDRNLVQGRGMFKSDQVLFAEQLAAATTFADRPEEFASAFTAAMVRPGRVGVKTGDQGEIRRDCSAFN